MAEGGTTGATWGNISLVGRATTGVTGQMRMHVNGFTWKKSGGGREVDVPKGDIESVSWMRIPGTSQLAVEQKSGKYSRFNGFRESDLPQIKEFVKTNFATDVQQREMAVSGRNWGKAAIKGSSLSFTVNGKTAFEVDCRDVGGVQQAAKTDLLVEFATDDTVIGEEKDSLFEMSFHVPVSSKDFPAPPKALPEGADGDAAAADAADEEVPAPAKVFMDRLMEHAAASTGDPIATFHEVAVLTPRGNFTIEMHATFLRLMGQAADFKIQYTNLVRLYILPRPNSPNIYAVLTLDSAIRKGQTFYQHIVMQFKLDAEVDLDTNPPEGYVSKHEPKLQAHYSGNEVDIFYQVLKALADVKVARQGGFRSAQGGAGESGSAAVRCVLRSDDGHLFCLNKVFFFLPKPPTLIRFDEVEQVEFERQSGKAAATKSFDLAIHVRNPVTQAVAIIRFTNIAQQEFNPLVQFFGERGIKVGSLAQDDRKQNPFDGLSDDEEDDYVAQRMREQGIDPNDSDEEDEDFKGDGSDGGSSSGSSSDSDSGSGGEGEEKKKKKKEKKEGEKKAKGTPKKRKGADGAEGGTKKKRQKKDKNAPKRGLSAFMFFSGSERAKVLADHPGIAFKDVGKQLGERWKALTKEEKEPYEAQARADKERYIKESKEYEAKKRAAALEAAGEKDSDDEKKSSGGSGSESDGGAAGDD